MVKGKEKFALWITPECKQLVDDCYADDQCQSRSEYIEKAIWFYSGFLHAGKADRYLPKALQQQMHDAEELMKNNTGVKFNVAANYGGQDELVRAMQAIAAESINGKLQAADINEAVIEEHLDTKGNLPVDLMIRTSGDVRVSNFLLWQAAYAEFWFTDTNWPDFTPECFVDAIVDYAKRDRRFGGLNNSK